MSVRTEAQMDALLDVLRARWEAHPNMRLAQLIVNATDQRPDLFYVEDDDLALALIDYEMTI